MVNIVGGIGSLVATAVFLQFWQPKEVWRFPEEPSKEPGPLEAAESGQPAVESGRAAAKPEVPNANPPPLAPHPSPLTTRQVAYAWMPWIILSAMIFLWGMPAWKDFLNGGKPDRPGVLSGVGRLTIEVPGLHNVVYRNRPVVKVPDGADRAEKSEEAKYEFNWLSTTGTSIFLAAVLSAFWLRVSPRVFWSEFAKTLFRVRWALMTIGCMLALAFTTKFSGADATLGLAFTHTGWFYPFFRPHAGLARRGAHRLRHPRATPSSAACKRSPPSSWA